MILIGEGLDLVKLVILVQLVRLVVFVLLVNGYRAPVKYVSLLLTHPI